MRILVLGASGGCGRWVVRMATERGHEVTTVVRPGTAYRPPNGAIVSVGSALDPAHVAEAARGQDVIISCVGPQRVNPRNPWSPLRPPGRVAGASARTVLDAVGRSTVRRVVAISAAGVGDSFAHTNAFMRWLIRRSTVGEMYTDLDGMEGALRGSAVDWLAVRPVTLVDAAPSRRARVIRRFRAHSIIGRADVAAWLLDSALDPRPVVERTPMIGWW